MLASIAGLGFGVPCAYGIKYFADRHEVWEFLGFPTYGGGPFEEVGVQTSVGLLSGFLAVCAAEVLTGVLLWRGQRAGRVLAFGLLPLELAFWIGFALPAGPLLGVARNALLLAERRVTDAA